MYLGSERLFAPNPFYFVANYFDFWFPGLGNLSVSWAGECYSPLPEHGFKVNFVP